MQILCNLSEGEGEKQNWLWKSQVLGLVIENILNAQIANNVLYLRLNKNVPPLYRSKVRYENEPQWTFQGKPIEEFALIPIVLGRGWGDCDDLGPWRVAELRCSGEKAAIRIQWQRPRLPGGGKGRKYYHIVVRRADKAGRLIMTPAGIEDPSAKLGMYDR